MPGAHRSTNNNRKLSVAGLVAVSASTVLMMAWAIFPSSAFAGTGTQQDPFGPGDKVDFCHYDGSDHGGGGSGKYNKPNASATATGPAGHIDHAFDVIPSYFFQQNANSPVEFFAGVNWPTLTNLPTSPVDFTPLLGSSASAFIAGGCGEPPPCPSGTSTVTATETTTTTQTFTTTVTAQPDAALAADGTLKSGGDGGDGALQEEQDECTTTSTATQTTTIPTTVTTTVPFCPEGETTTTVTQTVTTTVTADQALQQSPECTKTETTTTTATTTTTPPECPSGTFTTTTTSTAPPVTHTETVTDTTTVAGTETVTVTVGPNPVGSVEKASADAASADDVLQQVCEVTETVVTTPTTTVTEHVTTTVTTTPTVTTTTPIVSGSTVTPPPTSTVSVAPTTVTPPGGTAFTGAESVVPLGAIALMLMTTGSGLLWAGSRRRRGGEDEE